MCSHIRAADIPGKVKVSRLVANLYAIEYGDIVFNRTSETQEEVGLAAVYIGSQSVLFGGFVIRARPIKSVLDPLYAGYGLRVPAVRSQIITKGQGAVRANVGQESLQGVLAPIPPSNEQRAIATALSDADALIESLDRLIAKKRAIKQAAMKQLLTGETRLPGFHEESEIKRLGDHTIFLNTGTNSRSELNPDGSVVYLHYGDIHGHSSAHVDPMTERLPRIARDKVQRLTRLEKGDLVFVDASEDLEGVGKSVEVGRVPDGGMVAGLHTIAARFDKAVVADGFKGYLQFIPAVTKRLQQLAAGTKVLAMNRGHIAEVEVALPNTEEQMALAGVLSDMDAEIEVLERRREKSRRIKQGMMQELLTGRTRLVEPQQEAVEETEG
jgi:type I restriction enzyme S subunit